MSFEPSTLHSLRFFLGSLARQSAQKKIPKDQIHQSLQEPSLHLAICQDFWIQLESFIHMTPFEFFGSIDFVKEDSPAWLQFNEQRQSRLLSQLQQLSNVPQDIIQPFCGAVMHTLFVHFQMSNHDLNRWFETCKSIGWNGDFCDTHNQPINPWMTVNRFRDDSPFKSFVLQRIEFLIEHQYPVFHFKNLDASLEYAPSSFRMDVDAIQTIRKIFKFFPPSIQCELESQSFRLWTCLATLPSILSSSHFQKTTLIDSNTPARHLYAWRSLDFLSTPLHKRSTRHLFWEKNHQFKAQLQKDGLSSPKYIRNPLHGFMTDEAWTHYLTSSIHPYYQKDLSLLHSHISSSILQTTDFPFDPRHLSCAQKSSKNTPLHAQHSWTQQQWSWNFQAFDETLQAFFTAYSYETQHAKSSDMDALNVQFQQKIHRFWTQSMKGLGLDSFGTPAQDLFEQWIMLYLLSQSNQQDTLLYRGKSNEFSSWQKKIQQIETLLSPLLQSFLPTNSTHDSSKNDTPPSPNLPASPQEPATSSSHPLNSSSHLFQFLTQSMHSQRHQWLVDQLRHAWLTCREKHPQFKDPLATETLCLNLQSSCSNLSDLPDLSPSRRLKL